ncbi:MAG: AAA family ATPase [Candidatus Woesearchaeota archaeon]
MRIIGVLSGKGGVGKTTTAVNLGVGLAKYADTLVIDANISTPTLGIHLGNPTPRRTIHHALSGKMPIANAIYKHASGLKLIPGSLSIEDLELIDTFRLLAILKDLRGHSDIIILDAAPGLGAEALTVLESCDEVLIVTNADLPSVAGALKTLKAAKRIGKTVLGAVVTKSTRRDELKIHEIEKMLATPILAVIKHDKNIIKALKEKQPVLHHKPKCRASKEYAKLAKLLIGQK